MTSTPITEVTVDVPEPAASVLADMAAVFEETLAGLGDEATTVDYEVDAMAALFRSFPHAMRQHLLLVLLPAEHDMLPPE